MFQDTKTIANGGNEPLPVWLEPYGQDFQILPGQSYRFVGTSAQEGQYDVVDYGDKIGIYDWPGACTKVFHCDTLIYTTSSFRVDDPPSGMPIRQFIETAFGGPGGTGKPLELEQHKRPWWKFW